MTEPSTAIAHVPGAEYARLARFVARVGALTPHQWGELDAVAQRLYADDPVARWRRARRLTGPLREMPLLHDVMTAVCLTAELAGQLEYRLVDARRMRGRCEAPAAPRPPHLESVLRASAELYEVARAQPGGPGAAERLLQDGLVSLWLHHRSPTAELEERYAPIEPFIPLASVA